MAGKPRLRLPRARRGGIPLAEVIAVHRQFNPPLTLRGNLGDGFLMLFNPIYRQVRREFHRLGFRFTPREIAGYYAFPLMALDEILAARRLPYRDNFHWLVKLERAAPGAFSLADLKASELQFNYLFHESAHFLAHAAFFGRRRVRDCPKSFATLLRVMLGEAFANSVECLSHAFAEGEIGTYFLDANCHFRANAAEVRVLRRSARRWGRAATMRALFAGFLYANFLREKLSARERTRALEFAGLPKAAAPVLRIGLQLSEEFRVTTTPLHLRKQGFPMDLNAFFRRDPVAALLADKKLRAAAEALIERACAGG